MTTQSQDPASQSGSTGNTPVNTSDAGEQSPSRWTKLYAFAQWVVDNKVVILAVLITLGVVYHQSIWFALRGVFGIGAAIQPILTIAAIAAAAVGLWFVRNADNDKPLTYQVLYGLGIICGIGSAVWNVTGALQSTSGEITPIAAATAPAEPNASETVSQDEPLPAFGEIDANTAAALYASDDKENWYAYSGYQFEVGNTSPSAQKWMDEVARYGAWQKEKPEPTLQSVNDRRTALIKKTGLKLGGNGWEGGNLLALNKAIGLK